MRSSQGVDAAGTMEVWELAKVLVGSWEERGGVGGRVRRREREIETGERC